MSQKLNCIMLVDDNKHDNFFHEMTIKENDSANIVVAKLSGTDALTYLKEAASKKEPIPDLLFLDINMPGMNGWEFLEEYKKLDKELQNRIVIVILSTSDNPDDINKSKKINCIADFITKPLTAEMLYKIIDTKITKEKNCPDKIDSTKKTNNGLPQSTTPADKTTQIIPFN